MIGRDARGRYAVDIGGALGAAALLAPAVMPEPAHAVCSVLDPHPCAPSFCSVFDPGPCIPDYGLPFGQGLRLTVQSRSNEGGGAPAPAHALNTIQDVFAALRACWLPPPADQGPEGHRDHRSLQLQPQRARSSASRASPI